MTKMRVFILLISFVGSLFADTFKLIDKNDNCSTCYLTKKNFTYLGIIKDKHNRNVILFSPQNKWSPTIFYTVQCENIIEILDDNRQPIQYSCKVPTLTDDDLLEREIIINDLIEIDAFNIMENINNNQSTYTIAIITVVITVVVIKLFKWMANIDYGLK